MRVLIAEDQLLLLDGLTRMLTAHGFDVVGHRRRRVAAGRGPRLGPT
jgi:DNA-binding NarL/FixJ family response regulator